MKKILTLICCFLVISLIVFDFLGCKGQIGWNFNVHRSDPADFNVSMGGADIRNLLDAPEKVQISDHMELYVATYLWNNFQPAVSPADTSIQNTSEKRLNAIIRIINSKKEKIPEDLKADRLWLINDKEIWETGFSEEERPVRNEWSIEKIARNGPVWRSGSRIIAVVRITVSGKTYIIKARDQKISQAL